MGRNNETWLMELRRGGPDQQTALSDLRSALLGGLRRALSTRADADDAFLEDVVQDSLLRILDRLPQFEGRSRFTTWATSIAVRIAMSELRRRRWRNVSLDDVMEKAEVQLPTTDGVSRLSAQLDRQVILDKVHEIIEHDLTDKQRIALLAELNGVPQDGIVRHLGSNRNAVYKLTHDARRRLKRGLEASGYRADDIHAAFAT